jgi:DnaA N-terminal domain/TIR domain
MASKPPDAFLSYTRFDDEYHHGAISEFRRQLCMVVQAVTGKRFEIFQDIDGIGLGEPWLEKLDRMIADAHFFIPILTPNYLESQACRDELCSFLQAEAAAQRQDLILPIYYIRCPVFEDQRLRDTDRLAKAIHQRQRWEWRDLRHNAFRTRRVRLAIEELAVAIQKARERRKPSRKSSARVPTAATPALVSGGPATSLKPSAAAGALDQEWSRVRILLREEFGETAYRTWLEPLSLQQVEEERVLLAVPTRFLRDWVAVHYADRILVLWQRVNPVVRGLGLELAQRFTLRPGTAFRDIDAPWCPELVVIPPGEFIMGSTEAEREWAALDRTLRRHWLEWEKPQHLVTIA